MGQAKACPHCGGEGTCRRSGPQDSCQNCLEFHANSLEYSASMRLVPCFYCGGTGKFMTSESYLPCAHCQGARYCKPNGESPGCDYCMEVYREGLVGKDAFKPIVMVPCACCKGAGFIRNTPIKVEMKQERPKTIPKKKAKAPKTAKVMSAPIKDRPTRKLGWFRLTLIFILAFLAAFISVFWLTGFLQTKLQPVMAIKAGEDIPVASETIRLDQMLVIHSDHSITVEETIVTRNNRQSSLAIRRDLSSDNPILTGGEQAAPGFQVDQVLLNGDPVPYRLNTKDSGVILIQNAKPILPAGINTLTLKYRLWNLVQVKDDSHELTWHVIGEDWPFPVQQVSVTIGLPRSPKPDLNGVETGGGIGLWGQKDFRATVDDDANVSFVTTRSLKAKEAFYVSLSWPKR